MFALALDYGVIKTIGNAGSVKQILGESGLYSSIIPSVLKQTGQIDTPIGSISANDPLVTQAANQAVPASDVQKNVESAIDNIYAWLDGKTPQPTFEINLSSSQSSFAKNLADEVQQRLASLPACTTPYTSASFDALNATCLPIGVSPSVAASSLQSNLTTSDTFSQVNLNANDLKGNTPGQSIFSDQLKNAPKQYQKLKKTPLVLALLSVLTAAALVFLRPTWRSGLRHVGVSIVVVGVFMLAFAWIFNAAVTKKVVPNLKIDNPALQTNLRHGITDLANKVEHNYWLFGGIYTVLGLVMVASPLALRPKAPSTTVAAVDSTPEVNDDSEAAPTHKKSS